MAANIIDLTYNVCSLIVALNKYSSVFWMQYVQSTNSPGSVYLGQQLKEYYIFPRSYLNKEVIPTW